MKDRVCIHGAARSIGSSCVELASGRNHLILDYGRPLEGEGRVPFVVPKKRFHSYHFMLSHSHLDHCGYVNEIPKYQYPINEKIRVLATERTIRAMELQNPDVQLRDIESLCPDLVWGWHGFRYAFVYADHSAPDACSLIIATKRNVFLYTGDFRLHGRYSDDYIERIRGVLEHKDFARKPLTVITEATNAGTESGPSEQDVEDELAKEFEKPGLVMVKMANQNLQRIESVYNACKRSGRIMVTEPYTAYCALELGKQERNLAGELAGKPFDIKPDGKVWKVFNIQSSWTSRLAESGELNQFGGRIKITKDQFESMSDRVVAVANYGMQDFLEKKNLVNRVVWSMWKGYPCYEKLCSKYEVRCIHASGHIYEKDLIQFIKELSPRRTILMHSENPMRVAGLIGDFTEPIVLSDNQEIKLRGGRH